MNIPLNDVEITNGAIYLALYNELFISWLSKNDKQEDFDRNRFYSGVGFVLSDGLRTQLGYMRQVTQNWQKNQLQISLHHNF